MLVHHSTLGWHVIKKKKKFLGSGFGFRVSDFGFRVSGFGNLFDEVEDAGVEHESAQVIELGERAHQPPVYWSRDDNMYTGHPTHLNIRFLKNATFRVSIDNRWT